jgi:hypothetical protein
MVCINRLLAVYFGHCKQTCTVVNKQVSVQTVNQILIGAIDKASFPKDILKTFSFIGLSLGCAARETVCSRGSQPRPALSVLCYVRIFFFVTQCHLVRSKILN